MGLHDGQTRTSTYQRVAKMERQVVVRFSQDAYDAIVADAERHGRTVAQTVRFYVERGTGASGRQA